MGLTLLVWTVARGKEYSQNLMSHNALRIHKRLGERNGTVFAHIPRRARDRREEPERFHDDSIEIRQGVEFIVCRRIGRKGEEFIPKSLLGVRSTAKPEKGPTDGVGRCVVPCY